MAREAGGDDNGGRGSSEVDRELKVGGNTEATDVEASPDKMIRLPIIFPKGVHP